MATIGPEQVETEARSLLFEQIEGSAWYPGLADEERRQRIAQDVERYWPMMVHEAARRLVDRLATENLTPSV